MRIRWMNTLSALPAALASVPALAQTPANRPDYWHHGWGWGHMGFGFLMMILVWGVIIALIVLVVRWLSGGSSGGATPPVAPRNKALEILQERFARGEIDKAEFEERKRLLSD